MKLVGFFVLLRLLAHLSLVTVYVYLFGWDSVKRYLEGEIVISRKILNSTNMRPPG